MNFGKSLIVSKNNNDEKKPADAGKALARATSAPATPKVASGTIAKKIQDSIDGKKDGTMIAFVIDATGSRSRNWAASQNAQAKMFNKAAGMGQMLLSVVCHLGDEVRDLGTFSSGKEAGEKMAEVSCISGPTRLERSLSLCMNRANMPSSIVMVGDCCEDCDRDPNHQRLFDKAMDLAQNKIKVYAVHDPHGGDNGHGEKIYRKIAQITGGSFVSIDDDADFGNICEAIAVLEVGGLKKFQELIAQGNSAAKKLASGNTRLLDGPGMK